MNNWIMLAIGTGVFIIAVQVYLFLKLRPSRSEREYNEEMDNTNKNYLWLNNRGEVVNKYE